MTAFSLTHALSPLFTPSLSLSLSLRVFLLRSVAHPSCLSSVKLTNIRMSISRLKHNNIAPEVVFLIHLGLSSRNERYLAWFSKQLGHTE